MANIIEKKLGLSSDELSSIFSDPRIGEKLRPFIKGVVTKIALEKDLVNEINKAFNKSSPELKRSLTNLQTTLREFLAMQRKEVEAHRSKRAESTHGEREEITHGGKKMRKSNKRNNYKRRRTTKHR